MLLRQVLHGQFRLINPRVNLLFESIEAAPQRTWERRRGRRLPVWPKYSSGARIISKQTAEALAATDISATRFQRWGREQE